MTNFVWWMQLIFATIGTISSLVWYAIEKRRIRRISTIWGLWCVLMMSYRIYRFTLITVSANQILFINSLINWLLLFGAVAISYITTEHIIGIYRHGHDHAD